MLCLRQRSDWTLSILLESSSPLQPLPLEPCRFRLPVTDAEDGALEGGVEGDWRLGGRLDFWPVGEGLLSWLISRRE